MVMPALSAFCHSRSRRRPVTITRSPLATDAAALMARRRNEETVYQLVPTSIQVWVLRSNRRNEEASRKLVIGSPSAVVRCLGSVATKPVRVMVSVMTPVFRAAWPPPGGMPDRWRTVAPRRLGRPGLVLAEFRPIRPGKHGGVERTLRDVERLVDASVRRV